MCKPERKVKHKDVHKEVQMQIPGRNQLRKCKRNQMGKFWVLQSPGSFWAPGRHKEQTSSESEMHW